MDPGGAVQVAALTWLVYDWAVHARRDVDVLKARWRGRAVLPILYILTRLISLTLLIGELVTKNWVCPECAADDGFAGPRPHSATVAGTVLIASLTNVILALRGMRHMTGPILRRVVCGLYGAAFAVSATAAGLTQAIWAQHDGGTPSSCDPTRILVPASPVYTNILGSWLVFDILLALFLFALSLRPATLADTRLPTRRDITPVIALALATLTGGLLAIIDSRVRVSSIAVVHAALPIVVSRVIWDEYVEVTSATEDQDETVQALPMLPSHRISDSHDFELISGKGGADLDKLSVTLPSPLRLGYDRAVDIATPPPSKYLNATHEAPRRSLSLRQRTPSPAPSIVPDPSAIPAYLRPRKAPESAIAHRASQAELDFEMDFGMDSSAAGNDGASFLGIASGTSIRDMSSDDVSRIHVPLSESRRNGHRRKGSNASMLSWDTEELEEGGGMIKRKASIDELARS